MRATRLFSAALAALVLCSFWALPATAATIRVNAFAQVDADRCTITSAILAANLDVPVAGCPAGSGIDTIVIPPGTYTVTSPYEQDFFGDSTAFPAITTPIILVGEGPGRPVIERHPGAFMPFRLFRTASPVFELRNLTLAGGFVPNYRGGAIFAEDNAVIVTDVRFENNEAQFGGALADLGFFGTNGAEYTIERTTFVNNRASHGGGAIRVSAGGALLARHSHFHDNRAGAWGGAIYTPDGQHSGVTIEQSTFLRNRSEQTGGALQLTSPVLDQVLLQENTAHAGGGALYAYGGRPIVRGSSFLANAARRGGAIEVHGGSIEIVGSTLTGNSSTEDGGALYLDDRPGTSRLANSTFSGNQTVGRGGGVYLYGGGLDVNNVTMTANVSGYGAGLALGWWGGAMVRIANSIVAGNHDASGAALDVQTDPNEQLISLGYNVIGTDTGTGGAFAQNGDLVGTAVSPLDAGLVALADNGGPTLTHALAPFSPALDAGSTLPAGTAGTCEPVDQRGMVRPGPGSAACDVGAYEHGIYYALQVTIDGHGAVTGVPGISSCTETCTAEFGVGTVVTLTAQPLAGFVLVNWAGSCTGTDLTCVITLDGERSVTATFAAAGGATITTLTTSPNPSAVGEEVTLTAVVVPAPPALGVPTGTVTFLETTTVTVLGTIQLDANGIASTSTSALPQGQRTIQALYSGDRLFTTSAATTSHGVTGPTSATTTSLTSSPNPSLSGAPVTLTATVAAPGGGAPSGLVSFVHVESGTALGSAVVMAGGTAAITSSTLPEGSSTVRATYGGDLFFSGSNAEITHGVSTLASTAIRNGDPESRPQFDAVGMILAGPGHEACSGTMVSPLVVVTAAHCLRDVSADPVLEFSLGPGRTAPVTAIRVHPRFDPGDGASLNLAFDIALIKLDESVAGTWTDIVPLSLSETNPSLGAHATAVGVGDSGAGATRVSGDLLVNDYLAGEGPVGVFLPDAFIETVPGDAKNQMFCPAGAGGPLIDDDRVAGIASFRFVETCGEDGPGYYVNVARVATWIDTQAINLEAGHIETAIELTITPTPIIAGAPATLLAQVFALFNDAGSPAGTVTFLKDNEVLATVTLDEHARAEHTATFTTGHYTITARFDGGPVFLTSTAEHALVVEPPGPVSLDIVEYVSVSDALKLTPAARLTIAESILVSDQLTLTPAALLEIRESIAVSDAVSSSVDNTPSGRSVVVRVAGVTLTFDEVTRPGTTTATESSVPPPPAGFQRTVPSTEFEIVSTASFNGAVEVCLAHPPDVVLSRLMHFEVGAWVDRTTARDRAADTVCGRVTTLSPFAVFVPIARDGRMTGHGKIGSDEQFDFSVDERLRGRERGALAFEHTTPKNGKQKVRTDRFHATDIDDIVFWDDPAHRPSRRHRSEVDSVFVSGSGTWNGVSGYTFEMEAADNGERGRGRDTFAITIRDSHGVTVVSVDGTLTHGNVQSQRPRRR